MSCMSLYTMHYYSITASTSYATALQRQLLHAFEVTVLQLQSKNVSYLTITFLTFTGTYLSIHTLQ
jgi:hypothetical protein